MLNGLLFDVGDSFFAMAFHWNYHRACKNIYARGYVRGIKNRVQKRVFFHHLILPKKKGFEIDHINGNGLDNRRANLRYVTRSQNNHNRKNVKGYYFDSWSQKWKAELILDYKKHSLGRFSTEEAARAAYLKAKHEFNLTVEAPNDSIE